MVDGGRSVVDGQFSDFHCWYKTELLGTCVTNSKCISIKKTYVNIVLTELRVLDMAFAMAK